MPTYIYSENTKKPSPSNPKTPANAPKGSTVYTHEGGTKTTVKS